MKKFRRIWGWGGRERGGRKRRSRRRRRRGRRRKSRRVVEEKGRRFFHFVVRLSD